MGVFETPGPEQTWPQGNPLAQPHPKPTPPPPLQTKLNRKQNGGSSSSGLPPRAKPLQPWDSLSAAGSTPARQGVSSSREPGAAALEQSVRAGVRAGDSALRSPRPLTHHPFPSPFPLPPQAGPCGVSGSGEQGRVTRPGVLAAGPWPQPGPEAERPRSPEPTPRTPASGMQTNGAPAPRPVAVQPPPSEAEPPVQTPRGRSSSVTLGPRGLRCPGRGEGSSGGGVH